MTDHFKTLDSLRGLAALSVVFCHLYLTFHENFYSKLLFEYGIFRITIAGSEAVILFFVLSGFVLSLSFYSSDHFSYGGYIVKRLCRIYIPYIVVILIAGITRQLFYTGILAGSTDWLNSSWSKPIDIRSITHHLLMIGPFTSNLNNVTWSLVHEMRISLIFPIMVFFLARVNFKKGLALGIMLSGMSVIYNLLFKPHFWGTELYVTFHYSAFFIMGALLAKYHGYILKTLSVISSKSKNMFFFSGILMYVYFHPAFILTMLIPRFNPFIRMVVDSWFTSLGAALLLAFAISANRFSWILRNPMISFIGKISYSLYLCHLVVILSLTHLLNKMMPAGVITLISLPVIFVMSILMYYLVEKPAMRLGKFLAGKDKAVYATTTAPLKLRN